MIKRITAGFALCLALLCNIPKADAQTIITLGCAASSGTTCTTKGPGRTYGAWGELTAALNGTTLTAPTQIQVYNDGAAVPSDGTTLTVTSSATNTLTLMPAAGQGFARTVGHLCYDSTRGAAIENGGSNAYAVRITTNYVTVTGMQLRDGYSSQGALLITSASGGIVNVTGNILSSLNTVNHMNQVIGGKQTIATNVIIVETFDNAYSLRLGLDVDSSDANSVIANNIIAVKPGMTTNWLGLNMSSSGNARTVQNNIIVGFAYTTAMNYDTAPTGGYNATDQAAMGDGSLTGDLTGIAYTTANFTALNWTTPYGPSSTLDLTPISTSAFKGVGSPSPVVTTDIFGRSFSSDIGPVKLSSGPTYDATKMFLMF